MDVVCTHTTAAKDIINNPVERKDLPCVDFSKYDDIVSLKASRKARVIEEIKKDGFENV